MYKIKVIIKSEVVTDIERLEETKNELKSMIQEFCWQSDLPLKAKIKIRKVRKEKCQNMKYV